MTSRQGLLTTVLCYVNSTTNHFNTQLGRISYFETIDGTKGSLSTRVVRFHANKLVPLFWFFISSQKSRLHGAAKSTTGFVTAS